MKKNKKRKLSRLESLCLLAILLLKQLLLLIIQRQFRTIDLVGNDYDRGDWQRVLDKKKWLQYQSVQDYVTCLGESDFRIVKLNNDLYYMQTHDYYKFRNKEINSVMIKYSNRDDQLCELGCGFGFNLFSLKTDNNFKKLFGFDISKNSLLAGREICEHFKIQDIFFNQIDLIDSKNPSWIKLKNKTVFTFHCLEQLKHSLNDVLENIINSGAKRVIHIEPTAELLNLWCIRDLAEFLYIKRRDYLDDLLTKLTYLEKNGRIKIIYKKRIQFSPTPIYGSTLCVWEPVYKL
jgi:hypothetical protein